MSLPSEIEIREAVSRWANKTMLKVGPASSIDIHVDYLFKRRLDKEACLELAFMSFKALRSVTLLPKIKPALSIYLRDAVYLDTEVPDVEKDPTLLDDSPPSLYLYHSVLETTLAKPFEIFSTPIQLEFMRGEEDLIASYQTFGKPWKVDWDGYYDRRIYVEVLTMSEIGN